MTTENPKAGAEPVAEPVNVASIEAAAQAKAIERVKARNAEVRAMLKKFDGFEGIDVLAKRLMDDPTISPDDAGKEILDFVAKGVGPLAGDPRIEMGETAEDKFKKGVSAALHHRMGMAQDDRANPYRGRSLSDMIAASFEVKGQRIDGLTKNELASKILAVHSTSDFPLILEDAINKSLQAGFAAYPQIWDRIARVGSVSDFKTVKLLKMGNFSSLVTKLEGAEYTAGTMSEEREQITASTKGRYISLTREMIVNDDLSAFTGMSMTLGQAAARTVNADVLGVLTANGTTADGFNLFSTDHANYTGSGTAISVASLGLGRKMMRLQKDPSGLDPQNIQPRFLLCPVGKEDLAREVVLSGYNTDTTGQLKRNPIQDWGALEILSDPELDDNSATAWYLIADPTFRPLVQIHFLDGQRTPYVDNEEEFLTDSIRWKVRMDYGVGVNEWRAGYKNVGG